MSDSSPDPVTALLAAAAAGDREATERLAVAVYDELHRLAAAGLRREAAGHTLQPTEVVHEAFIRLQRQSRVTWQNRTHFYAVAAQVMRRVLVDHARKRRAARRDHGVRVTFDEASGGATPPADLDVLAVHDALERLAALDARQARVVELRYFGGLSIDEVAEVTGTSPATVKRDWTFARAYLLRLLAAGEEEAAGSPSAR